MLNTYITILYPFYFLSSKNTSTIFQKYFNVIYFTYIISNISIFHYHYSYIYLIILKSLLSLQRILPFLQNITKMLYSMESYSACRLHDRYAFLKILLLYILLYLSTQLLQQEQIYQIKKHSQESLFLLRFDKEIAIQLM